MPVDIWSIIITLSILAVTVVFFTLGKFRSDIIAVCALLALMLAGVLTPQEALSGFSNPIIMTIAGVFIIGGAIVRSGLANVVGGRILQLAGESHNALFMLVMLITSIVGSLVSNTGTVAIMMPIVASMAMAINASPSRFLMPVAFMSSIGGMLTLIGNPANMVVNDVYVKAGYTSMTLFSFFPVGIVSLAFGMLVLAPATSYFLARRKNKQGEPRDKGTSLKDLADKYHLAQHLFTITVPSSSTAVGKTLGELDLTGKCKVAISEIRREEQQGRHFGAAKVEQITPTAQTAIRAGDVLYGLGSIDNMNVMAETYGFMLSAPESGDGDKGEYRFESFGICELVLMSASRLVQRTVAESRLREQFGVTLLGVQRGDQYILEDLKDVVLQAGDSLLVQGPWDVLSRLQEYSQHWVVVGSPQDQGAAARRQRKIPFVSFVVVLMVVSMATGILPTVVSVMLAAVALIAGRCFSNIEEAYSSINWETLIMISCMLPMALAMEKTGLVMIASEYITQLGSEYGPLAALALVYGMTSLMNIVISGTPVALLVAPVAIKVSLDLGISPLPFLYGVATASCMCFASPFSTPANALVMSAGRYTFFDYLKIGLPLQMLMGVVMVLALPFLFPF